MKISSLLYTLLEDLKSVFFSEVYMVKIKEWKFQKRNRLQKMIDFFPELYYEPKDESLKHTRGHCLFDTEIWDGEFWGEDYVFCRRARKCEFKIWIDPTIKLDHAGVCGAFIECLTDQPQNMKENL